MLDRNWLLWLAALAAAFTLASCGDSDTQSSDAPEPSDDVAQIQEALTEAITRWHYGDKAVLYDNEFSYLRDDHTFDDYMGFDIIKWMEADTVVAIEVDSATIFERDSATVFVEVMFVGPTLDTSYDHDAYRMYYHNERWIRPTVSRYDYQTNYDSLMRAADSAAQAEAEEFGE